MKKLFVVIGVLSLGSVAAAIAQTATSDVPQAPNIDRQIPEAPIGHRQPHAKDLPDDLYKRNDAAAAAAADKDLDRKIKGICRGC
jgi:hypothetical protein